MTGNNMNPLGPLPRKAVQVIIVTIPIVVPDHGDTGEPTVEAEETA
jgi:hypothetical protein